MTFAILEPMTFAFMRKGTQRVYSVTGPGKYENRHWTMQLRAWKCECRSEIRDWIHYFTIAASVRIINTASVSVTQGSHANSFTAKIQHFLLTTLLITNLNSFWISLITKMNSLWTEIFNSAFTSVNQIISILNITN